ncbi:type II toxin-antitoxin system VapC family toxin [Maribrevibacterium harenarium]|uniref:Type II toxin-antitoxin system VapC family toxin n=1 Tax=Maribrevibacterium harenarium TaxID=2589817 RepID=A0A501WMK4_9GAMM|nr:type II toxin-antitoxin system VapC family toxin [Maribrevibacterium harenarium]TPE46966.1 type II toxin-antitoxin system VapC family toxin [Maribrevibacterium harenarium]
MYLLDTNIISELRKGVNANPGVYAFFQQAISDQTQLYLSVITIGELRRGVEMIRHRGDHEQARRLEQWLNSLVSDYADRILPFDQDAAQVWGKLRVPHHENAIDKQIAATALLYDLTVVTLDNSRAASCGDS